MRLPVLLRCFRVLLAVFAGAFVAADVSAAAVPGSDFSIEVSPSPLVTTVKPGTTTTLELRIRNASTKPERLRIQARDFTSRADNGQITIGDTAAPDLADRVDFSDPTFTVGPGEWFTQKITITLAEEAGFSYPFAALVSRAEDTVSQPGTARLQGSVAVFVLVNIDRPGATRRLEIESLSTSRGTYEYLPATVTFKLKDTGNTIVQPYGNVYVQRPGASVQALAVLPVNDSRGYILPGTSKEFAAVWNDGFPLRVTSTPDSEGKTTQSTTWDWTKAGDFRFGRYTARVVAAYNDGSRDIPLMRGTDFWVVPWRILLGLLAVLSILGVGLWVILRYFFQSFKSRASKRPQ